MLESLLKEVREDSRALSKQVAKLEVDLARFSHVVDSIEDLKSDLKALSEHRNVEQRIREEEWKEFQKSLSAAWDHFKRQVDDSSNKSSAEREQLKKRMETLEESIGQAIKEAKGLDLREIGAGGGIGVALAEIIRALASG